MGCQDYFDSGNLCLIEWPENIADILPEEAVSVYIKVADDDTRCVEIEK